MTRAASLPGLSPAVPGASSGVHHPAAVAGATNFTSLSTLGCLSSVSSIFPQTSQNYSLHTHAQAEAIATQLKVAQQHRNHHRQGGGLGQISMAPPSPYSQYFASLYGGIDALHESVALGECFFNSHLPCVSDML